MELKVGLHCEECIKKILKAIKKIEGITYNLNKNYPILFSFILMNLIFVFMEMADIETYNVDTKLNKVIVTGNVSNDQVIRVLQKIGKQATAWDQ